jgi:hypothetical protein
VREVSYDTAEAIILKYEWLGTMPAIVRYCYGIFFDGCCGGVVVYGDEYAENLGVWDKYGFTGKIICLARGACVHWAPPHAGSKLIRRSLGLLPIHYKIVTCTTDHEAGEVGTIYQACGFVFVQMNTHARYQIEGVPSRAVRGRLKNKDQIIAAGLTPKVEHQKGRYFAFRGTAGERKHSRRAVAHLIKPYPKRAEEVSSRDMVVPLRQGGGQYPDSAPISI